MSFFARLAQQLRAAAPHTPAAAYAAGFAAPLPAPTARDILARCVDVWTTPRTSTSL